ncbi:MAG: DUF4153 domain-containing protein [Muribaculaceae bacterium]|nr:DUF4153 domain-containing protein [Muribaculaceae bacterium]
MKTSLLSPTRIKKELATAWRLYPATLIFIAADTLFALSLIWEVIRPSEIVGMAAGISLSLGTLLSLAVYRWCAYLGAGASTRGWQIACAALVTANFAVLATSGTSISDIEMTGYSAAYTALAVAIFFLPGLKASEQRHLWSNSAGVLGAAAVAVAVSVVLTIASAIIWGTLSSLFGFHNERIMLTLITLLSAALPAVVFLCHIPSAAKVHDDDSNMGFGLSVAALCKNVLLPVTLVYTLVLYVYAAKILVLMELPKGTVSWMVTGLVTVVLVIIYGLQGYLYSTTAKESAKRVAALALRYMPVLMLPLLVLMSVAIGYRIGQYGFTASRLYVLTFNVWAYIVMDYLCIAKVPRLNLVATSFALVFLLISAIPGFNYGTLGIKCVQEKVRTELLQAGVKELPISEQQLRELLEEMPRKDAESLAMNLDYLDRWDDHSRVAHFVQSEHRLSHWSLIPYSYGDEEVVIVATEHEYGGGSTVLSPVPEGFSSIQYKWLNRNLPERVGDKIKLPLDSCSLLVPADSIVHTDADSFRPVMLPVAGASDGSVYMLCGYTLRVDSAASETKIQYVSTEGYILKP